MKENQKSSLKWTLALAIEMKKPPKDEEKTFTDDLPA